MQNATLNPPTRPGANLDRIFAVGAGAVLVLVGLVFLVQIGLLIWLPARQYEAAATFALYPHAPGDAQDDLQNVWNLLPPDAAVGLELEQGQPHVYRLSFRSPDPAQAAKQANALVTVVQANSDRTSAGHFQLLHPAEVPVECTSPRNRQLRSSLLLLLLAALPIYQGLRFLFPGLPPRKKADIRDGRSA